MKCMSLSNTTLLMVYIYIYIHIYMYNLLHKDLLHVSALDNGHLQVEINKVVLDKDIHIILVYF